MKNHKHVCVTKCKEERLKAEQLARQKAKAEAAKEDPHLFGQACGGPLGGERRRGALTEYTSPLGS